MRSVLELGVGRLSSPQLRAGPSADPADRDDAIRIRRLVTNELASTRRAASGWARGIAGIFIAIAGLGVVHGRADVETLAAPFPLIVGIALALAVVAGVAAAVATMRAAHGRPGMISLPKYRARITDTVSEHAEARSSIRALAIGIVFAGVSVLAIVVAIAAMWYGPGANPAVVSVIDDDGTRWCGSVERVIGGFASIQTEEGIVRVDLATIRSLAAVADCS